MAISKEHLIERDLGVNALIPSLEHGPHRSIAVTALNEEMSLAPLEGLEETGIPINAHAQLPMLEAEDRTKEHIVIDSWEVVDKDTLKLRLVGRHTGKYVATIELADFCSRCGEWNKIDGKNLRKSDGSCHYCWEWKL